MSVATPFLHLGSFPFCVGDISGTIPATFDSIDNLTLADVMGFFWNLETLEFVTAGSASNGNTTDCTGVASIHPVTDNTPFDEGGASGCWYGEVTSGTAWASFPAFRQPRERVCYASSSQNIASLSGSYITGAFEATWSVSFRVGLDPVNSGKYVLYYEFSFDFEDVGDGGPLIAFRNPANNSGAVLVSGTITVGGFTMNWEATDFGTSSSNTGLDLSATSSYYTY